MKNHIKFWLILSCFAGASAAYGQLITAFQNDAGTVGAQSGDGPWALGNDFTVNSPIIITELGAFDSGSDGIFSSPVSVAIYNADTQQLVSPVVSFSTASPGTAAGGSRFKYLGVAITLPAGFHGSVVGANYGGPGGEPDGNVVSQASQWSFNDGGGQLTLGSDGRFSLSPTMAYPSSEYANGGSPAFAAGTFVYTTVPEPTEYAAVAGLALISFSAWRRIRR